MSLHSRINCAGCWFMRRWHTYMILLFVWSRVSTGREFPDRERDKPCPVPAGKFRSGISGKSGQNFLEKVATFHFWNCCISWLKWWKFSVPFKCMDFLPLRRSFSTKIPKFFFFWPKPFYYLPWHGFEGWFGEKVPGSGPGSRFKRAYLKKGRFWGEKVSALRGYKMVKFWDFWPEIWYGPMILPLFLTFGKKNWSRVTFTK